MNKYRASFEGRQVGAIGVSSQYNVHTKGPWFIESSKIRTDYVYIHAANGPDVARLEITPYAMANAALIAASPSMLEALKLAYQILSGEVENDGINVRQIEKAILKAEGK